MSGPESLKLLILILSFLIPVIRSEFMEIEEDNSLALDEFFGLLLDENATTCIDYVNQDSRLVTLDNRPIDIVLKSLNSLHAPNVLVKNSLFNLKNYIKNDLCDLFIVVTDEMEFFDRILIHNRNPFNPFSSILIIFYGTDDVAEFLQRNAILRINNKKAINLMLAQIDFDRLSSQNYSFRVHHYTSQMTIKRLTVPFTLPVQDLEEFVRQEEWQPIFEENKLDAFRVSLFHCPPFVINLNDANSSVNARYGSYPAR